jgi:hypothetical protein
MSVSVQNAIVEYLVYLFIQSRLGEYLRFIPECMPELETPMRLADCHSTQSSQWYWTTASMF